MYGSSTAMPSQRAKMMTLKMDSISNQAEFPTGCPPIDIKVFMQDINVKLGNEYFHRRITEKQSIHNESKDIGERLIDSPAVRSKFHPLLYSACRVAKNSYTRRSLTQKAYHGKIEKYGQSEIHPAIKRPSETLPQANPQGNLQQMWQENNYPACSQTYRGKKRCEWFDKVRDVKRQPTRKTKLTAGQVKKCI